MKTKEKRTALLDAILAVAEASAELAVTRADQDAGYYETDCAYMSVSRASEQLEKALDDIFGAGDD